MQVCVYAENIGAHEYPRGTSIRAGPSEIEMHRRPRAKIGYFYNFPEIDHREKGAK